MTVRHITGAASQLLVCQTQLSLHSAPCLEVTLHILSTDDMRGQIPGTVQIQEEALLIGCEIIKHRKSRLGFHASCLKLDSRSQRMVTKQAKSATAIFCGFHVFFTF